MTVIQASSAGVKDLADGTLRITFDFEPSVAKEAFALFGVRGSSVAIARLKDGHAAAVEEKPASKASETWNELGPLCQEAVRLAQNPAFHAFVRKFGHFDPEDYIKRWCDVESRKDLDTNPGAAQAFAVLRKDFQAYVRKATVAA